MRWSELVTRAPQLGAIAQQRLIDPGVVLVGTTRRDGSARISGVEPLILDGELLLSMMRSSTKAQDLRRDPRILLHGIITGPEPAAEIKLRGTVRTEHDEALQQRYAAAVADQLGWQPVVGQFVLFAIDVHDLTYLGYDPETSAQHVARWPAGVEYLRAAITPTSLGPRQPIRRLLPAPPD